MILYIFEESQLIMVMLMLFEYAALEHRLHESRRGGRLHGSYTKRPEHFPVHSGLEVSHFPTWPDIDSPDSCTEL